MIEDNMCTLRLVRPSLYVDRFRSYKILLNGKKAGRIGNDRTLEIVAPAGSITIEAKMDWTRSQPLTINTMPRQTFELEVRNQWGAARRLWSISFGRNSYLLVTPR
ncbi:MAG: hypothetical protein ACXWKP_27775 [Bradyrhizobium sp.]